MQDKQKKAGLNEERSIDLLRLVQVLWKRAWLILLVALLCGVIVFAYSKLFIAPSYRSSFTAYVNNRINTAEGQGNSTSTADITASRSLTYLYQEIIRSRSVLMSAAAECGVQMSYSQLLKNVSTSVATNAAIISVSVDAPSAQEAELLASAIAAVAPEQVARVVDGSSMRIVDYPIKPVAPFAPNSMEHAMLGFFVGLLLAVLCVILFDLIVDKVESPKEMEIRYDIAVVGIIPDMHQADKHQYGDAQDSVRRKSV